MRRLRGLAARFIICSVVGAGFLGSAGRSSLPRPSLGDRDHYSPGLVRVTWPNGESRTLSFKGVGCAMNMCSRVRIQSKIKDSLGVSDTWLDSVASVRHITNQDALFILKDGTSRRLPVISGNRFLYFANGKSEMGKFESVEFVAP